MILVWSYQIMKNGCAPSTNLLFFYLFLCETILYVVCCMLYVTGRQKEMSEMRDQMIASQTPGKDGFPIFNLFVRTKKANVSLCSLDCCLLVCVLLGVLRFIYYVFRIT